MVIGGLDRPQCTAFSPVYIFSMLHMHVMPYMVDIVVGRGRGEGGGGVLYMVVWITNQKARQP